MWGREHPLEKTNYLHTGILSVAGVPVCNIYLRYSAAQSLSIEYTGLLFYFKTVIEHWGWTQFCGLEL